MKQKNLITKIYKDPNFAGKHVIIIDDKVFSRKTGEARARLLKRLVKKYPDKTPLITYIPGNETLILLL